MPTLHVKPNREELLANMDVATKELEAAPAQTPITPPPAPPEEATPPSTPPEEIPEAAEEVEAEAEIEATPPPDDWKKRYSDSTREAQSLAFKNKELNAAIEEAGALPPLTTEELQGEYSDWDDMTPTEQRLAKDNLQNKRRFDLIQIATAKFKQVDQWGDKVTTFIEDPKNLIAHPELEGKTDEFKLFATKPSRRNIDFDDIVLAFNGDQAKNKPAPKKGKMFEVGSGGPKEPEVIKDDKLSVDESRALMQTDYKKWKEYLKAGKIRNE